MLVQVKPNFEPSCKCLHFFGGMTLVENPARILAGSYRVYIGSYRGSGKKLKDLGQQECILFCAGKTRIISNWSDLFRSHMLRSCQFPVGVPYFAQVSTTFVV